MNNQQQSNANQNQANIQQPKVNPNQNNPLSKQTTRNVEQMDDHDILNSKQLSAFQKSNFTRHPIKFQSTIVNSDDDDDSSPKQQVKPEKKLEQKIVPSQEQKKQIQTEKIEHKSIYKSQLIESGSEEDEEDTKQNQIPQKQETLPTQNSNQHSFNQETIAELSTDTEQKKFVQLDVEEVIRQSQIVMSKLKSSSKDMKTSKNVALIEQIDSEDEDEENREELEDQVPEDLKKEIGDENQELNSENRILLSVMQTSLTKSIQKQQKQHILNQSLKSSVQSSTFRSKLILSRDNQNNQTIMFVPEDEYFYDKINGKYVVKKFILRLQCFQKYVKKAKKEYLRMRKQNRYRMNVINELFDTEVKYVSDLEIIVTQIQQPLIKRLPPQHELDIQIMLNLDSIYYFNKEFLRDLQDRYLEQTKQFEQSNAKHFKKEFIDLQKKQKKILQYFPYIKIMEKTCNLLAGFKFYFEYCKGFDTAAKLLQNYENNNPEFIKFMKEEVQKNNLLKGMDIGSYLIKPVQRLPKYVLLYKDLLKHTDKDHPDYEYIQKCLKSFEDLNDENNKLMKIKLDQLKILELQQQFSQHLTVVLPNRSFVFEDVCSIYTDKPEQGIIIYAFNNMLLFAKKQTQSPVKYRMHMDLTHQSFVKDKEDTNYYSHLFEVVDKTNSIIIINSDKETKMNLMKRISEIIDIIKKQKQNIDVFRRTQSSLKPAQSTQPEEQEPTYYDIKVVIVGTESRNYQSKPFTIYVANVFIEDIQSKIFVRYSQIVQVQQIVSKYDPKLKVPVFSSLNWFHSIESKVIDERKILIEKFLQIVLNSEKCQQIPEYQKQILELLNLTPDFYNIPQKKKKFDDVDQQQAMQMILQSQFNTGIQPNLLQSMIMNRQTTQILQAQQKQARKSVLEMDEEKSIQIGADAQKCPYKIEISLMDGRVVDIGFQKGTLALFVKNKIAKFVGLKQCIDFRLFIVDNNKDQRVIDDDEQVSAILDAYNQKAKGIANAFKKLFVSEPKYQFIFRKFFYLSWKQEEADYKIDPIRLRYIVYEVIWETRNEKYNFSFNDYCLIAALFFFQSEQPLDMIMLQKIVPKNYLKNSKEKIWFEQIIADINLLKSQLIKVQNENSVKQKLEQKNYITTICGIAHFMIMNFYKTKHIFGMTLFFVECNKETIQAIQKGFSVKINSNIFLGLNYNGFHFLRPEDKAILLSSQYEKLSETKAFTTEFSCVIQNVKLSFKTQFPYEIKALITEYLSLNTFTNQLKTQIRF